jgi:hypothetical protein
MMFFILSKTLALLLLSSSFLIAIGIVGVALLLTRWTPSSSWAGRSRPDNRVLVG